MKRSLISLAALLTVAFAVDGVAQTVTPQGRLTLLSATPFNSADVTAATNVYYACAAGNHVRINGTDRTIPSCQLTLALDSTNHVNNRVYDVGLMYDGANVQICTGPVWSYAATVTMTIASPAVVTWTAHGLKEGDPIVFTTSGALPTGITAGTVYFVGRSPATDTFNVSTTIANAAVGTFINTSGSQSGTHTGTNRTRDRGTGAGTTELVLGSDGLWTNNVDWSSCFNGVTDHGGANTQANEVAVIGSVFITADGQTEATYAPVGAAGGTANKVGICNLYQTVPTRSRSVDSTDPWTYATTTWRGANGSVAGGSANRVNWLDCWPGGRPVMASYFVGTQPGSSGTNCSASGVNFNSTTATPGGQWGWFFAGVSANHDTTLIAFDSTTLLGWNYAQAMEERGCGTGTVTYHGGIRSNMVLGFMN